MRGRSADGRTEAPGKAPDAIGGAQSDFPLNLKDYRIGGLSKLLGVLKMYENIEVHVDVLFELGA